MKDKKILNNEQLEKVTGGMPELTVNGFAFEMDPGIVLPRNIVSPELGTNTTNPTSNGNITEICNWSCKNGHCFTSDQACRFGKLCPVCNEKIEELDHSIRLPGSVTNI